MESLRQPEHRPRLRHGSRRIRDLAVLALLAWALTALPGAGTTTALAQGSTQVSCQEYCNPSQPNRPGQRLTITGDAVKLDEEQLRLLWTVHRLGFELQAFESFPTLQAGTKSTDELAEYPGELSSNSPGLELVTVERDAESLSLDVEGLEPGVAYRWRLDTQPVATWVQGPTVLCIAPVCPADYVDQPVPSTQAPSTSAPSTSGPASAAEATEADATNTSPAPGPEGGAR